MKWNNLPQEILIMIFIKVKYIPYPYYDFQLAECALTCQGWKSAAQSILFSELFIKSNDHLKKVFSKEFSFGKLIREMELDLDEDDSDPPEQILELIAVRFPFIEKVLFCFNSYSSLLALYRLIMKGAFPHLKVVSSPGLESELIKLYTSCIALLQNRVTKVDIANEADSKSIEYKGLLDIINQLPNLSTVHLSFYHSGVDNFADFIESTISDINLELLEVSFLGPTDYDDAPIPLQVSGKQIKPLLRLKELRIYPQQSFDHTQPGTMIIGGDESLLYIMKKFPKVKTLILKCSLLEMAPESIPRPSVPVAVQFLLHLYRMRRCTVSGIVTNSNTIDILLQYYDNLNNVLKAPKLKNTLSVNCLESLPMNSQYFNTYLTVRTRELNDDPPNVRDIEVYLKKDDKGQYLSPFDLIKKVGKFAEGLSLNGCVSYKEESLLSCVVKYCTRMERLNISNMDQGFFHDQEVGISKNYQLKELSVDGYLSFSKMATQIQDHFPSLEHLYFKYDCKEEGEARQNFLEMKMPYLKLKHLKIALGTWEKARSLVISIKLTNGSNQTLYFTIALLSDYFSYSKSSHILKKITPRKYNENIINVNCANFSIQCESIEEITIAYWEGRHEFYKVKCLTELRAIEGGLNFQ